MSIFEVILIVIGAAIGFISSIGTIVIERWIDKKGKLKIYYKLYWSEKAFGYLGFFKNNNNEITLHIPIRIEIQNTSNTSRVVRDLSILMYNKGALVAKMHQVNSGTSRISTNGVVTDTEHIEYGTRNNSYSFVVQPRCISSENCTFMYSISINEIPRNTIDEIKMQYFDEKDRTHQFHLRSISDCWKVAKLKGDDDWILAR